VNCLVIPLETSSVCQRFHTKQSNFYRVIFLFNPKYSMNNLLLYVIRIKVQACLQDPDVSHEVFIVDL